MHSILVADDQAHIRDSLELLLEPEGYSVIVADSPTAVLKVLDKCSIDLLLMDMNYTRDTTSGSEGIDLLNEIRTREANLPIIVMTAWANIELSVNAIKSGANDFIEKPWNNARLLSTIRNQIAFAQQKQVSEKLGEINRREHSSTEFIANAPCMRAVMDVIERTASTDANILLTGESGVGKSMFAKHIHSLSARKQAPLVSVNMGALADNLFESELFGHVKGAFTDAKATRMGRFEMAEGGTLFLDEIANIPIHLQAKLLRVLESGEYESLGSSKTKRANVRLISASNVDFDKEIEQARFRQDLLYRLNTITINIPPLRERAEDIIPLANFFIGQLADKYRKPNVTLSEKASRALLCHSWPGNVRELSHCLERAVLMAKDHEICEHDLGLSHKSNNSSIDDMTLEQAEHLLITNAMKLCNGVVADAADKLGISRAALYRRLEKFQIDAE